MLVPEKEEEGIAPLSGLSATLYFCGGKSQDIEDNIDHCKHLLTRGGIAKVREIDLASDLSLRQTIYKKANWINADKELPLVFISTPQEPQTPVFTGDTSDLDSWLKKQEEPQEEEEEEENLEEPEPLSSSSSSETHPFAPKLDFNNLENISFSNFSNSPPEIESEGWDDQEFTFPSQTSPTNSELSYIDKGLDMVEDYFITAQKWIWGEGEKKQTRTTSPQSPGEVVEVAVIQNNWYGRKQARVLRFEKVIFSRIHPKTMEVRVTHRYDEIKRLQYKDKTVLVIDFENGSSEYYHVNERDKIIQLLEDRAKMQKKTFPKVEKFDS